MIREWCSYCGQRYEVTWPTLGVTGCPKNCDSLDFGDVGFAVADANAEIFWTAIAHERARAERLAAVYTLSAMLSEEIVALASLDATDRTDPKRFDDVRAEAMRLVDLIQTEVGK